MAEVTEKQKSSPANKVREFKLGIWDEVLAEQKGRVTRLTHAEFGTTYLIDVTDREDPTTKDPRNKSSKAEIVGEMLKDLIEDPQFQDHYAANNGVVALITNCLDENQRQRTYIGITMSNPEDKESKEITQHILQAAGFQGGKTFYVPMSFNSRFVRNYMWQEIRDAFEESGREDLLTDFRKLPFSRPLGLVLSKDNQ